MMTLGWYAIVGLSLARVRKITSRDNASIKELRTLATDARELRARQRTLLDGPHLIEAFRHHGGIPELLVLSDTGSRNGEAINLIAAYPEVDVLHVPDSLFREISGVATPVGILAVIRIPEASDAPIEGSCVMLDSVQDGGNIGTILRTAAAAGIRDILLGPGCASAWHPKVLRAAQGAHFGLRIREQVNLGDLLRENPGTSVATVAREGTPLFDLALVGNTAWIFGNEGSGVADDLLALAGQRTTIPIAADTESLNVAAAAAICLFEQVRQQRLARERQNA
jgi:TrmH family RNA methyltransferase